MSEGGARMSEGGAHEGVREESTSGGVTGRDAAAARRRARARRPGRASREGPRGRHRGRVARHPPSPRRWAVGERESARACARAEVWAKRERERARVLPNFPERASALLGSDGSIHCIALHCIALHCIALHCIAFHCIPLHSIAFHCIPLHSIDLAILERDAPLLRVEVRRPLAQRAFRARGVARARVASRKGRRRTTRGGRRAIAGRYSRGDRRRGDGAAR